MTKKRLRKARALINKYRDSWGSLRHRFNQRLLNKKLVRDMKKEIEKYE